MPRRGGKRGPRKRKSERLEWKIRYRFSPAALRGTNPEALKRKALKHFRDTGEQLKGTKIIIAWRNPDNKNPLHANWKTSEDAGQTLGAAFTTLHGSMMRATGSHLEEQDDDEY